MKYQNIHLDSLFITNLQSRESDDSWLLYDRNSSTFLLSPSIHERQFFSHFFTSHNNVQRGSKIIGKDKQIHTHTEFRIQFHMSQLITENPNIQFSFFFTKGKILSSKWTCCPWVFIYILF